MRKKWICAAAVMLAVCIGASVIFSVRVDAAAAPGIFHNDERWYRDSSAGLERIGNVYYIPVDVFSMFSQIELSMDSRRGEFMLYNRKNGQYISVLYEEKIATVNGEEEIYLSLYRLHGGYFYVPVEYFCQVLSLTCEKIASSNAAYGVTVRIHDGSQTQTLEELLKEYDPVPESTESSSADTETPSVSTVPPITSGADPMEHQDYLTFNTVGYESFADVLAQLRKAGVKAAFFFTEEEIRQYPQRLLSVSAAGHTVGLTCTDAADMQDFLRQMEEANALLYRLLKIRSRIVQYPEGSAKAGLTEADVQQLTEAGYSLWDWTYDVPDSVGYSSAYVETVCRRAVDRNEINVLRMSCNRTVAEILDGLLLHLQSGQTHTIYRIHAGLEPVYAVSLP